MKFSTAVSEVSRKRHTSDVRIKIGIVEGSRLLRDSLANSLKAERDLEPIAVSSCEELCQSQEDPFLIVVDGASRDTIARLRRSFPDAKLVCLNVEPEELELIDLIQLGVTSFILRDAPLAETLRCLRSVGSGEDIVPTRVALSLCRQLYERGHNNDFKLVGENRITFREQQIIELAVRGLSNKEIGRKLNVAEHTVKSHIHNILQKLHLRSRVDLTNYCWQNKSCIGVAKRDI